MNYFEEYEKIKDLRASLKPGIIWGRRVGLNWMTYLNVFSVSTEASTVTLLEKNRSINENNPPPFPWYHWGCWTKWTYPLDTVINELKNYEIVESDEIIIPH
jgi:hypothetical protein